MPRLIHVACREKGALSRSRCLGRDALPGHHGREGRDVLELSHPSLGVQGEDLVESMAVRDFKADKDKGCLKLLSVKNFGEYLTQWSN